MKKGEELTAKLREKYKKENPQRFRKFLFYFTLILSGISFFGNLSDIRYFGISYALGVFLFPALVFLFGFFIPHRRGKKVHKYTSIRNELIGTFLFVLIFAIIILNISPTKEKCVPPEEWVLTKCCIPEPGMNNRVCKEDLRYLEDALVLAIENNQVSPGLKREHTNPHFSFNSPKNYYELFDVYANNLPLPYYYLAQGETQGEYIEIYLFYVENGTFIDEEDALYKFAIGFEESMKKIGEDTYYINKTRLNNGRKVTVLEVLDETIPEMEHYAKTVSFVNENDKTMYILKYISSLNFSDYVYEFDEMVESFSFE